MSEFWSLDFMLAFFISGVVSLLLVGCYRALALRLGLVDIPNGRSSRVGVTPRGAGVVIVFLYGLGLGFFWSDAVPESRFLILALCPLALGLVGLADDYLGLSSTARLLIYFLLVIVAIASLGAPVYFPGAQIIPPGLIVLMVAIVLLWVINLFNFMDGINGIAGFEALFVLLSMHLLGHAETPISNSLMAITTGAIVGFLLWNFPAGKVFLGDVGSIFLGALLGVYLVGTFYVEGGLFWSYMILLGIFFVDSTYTLFVRLFSGLRITEAHRSHAYQRLSRKWGSHTSVVGIILLLNLCWLLPLAWLAMRSPVDGPWLVLLAYSPLLAICHALGAGQQD
jgi:Fuc2NAc and GlcNAc transferase